MRQEFIEQHHFTRGWNQRLQIHLHHHHHHYNHYSHYNHHQQTYLRVVGVLANCRLGAFDQERMITAFAQLHHNVEQRRRLQQHMTTGQFELQRCDNVHWTIWRRASNTRRCAREWRDNILSVCASIPQTQWFLLSAQYYQIFELQFHNNFFKNYFLILKQIQSNKKLVPFFHMFFHTTQ